MNKEFLIEDEGLEFFKVEVVSGIYFEVFLDEAGQSFHLAWVDPRTGEIKTWCCGAYNDYRWDMEDIAEHIIRKREQNGEEKN